MNYKTIITLVLAIFLNTKLLLAVEEVDDYKSLPEGQTGNIGNAKHSIAKNFMVVTADPRATISAKRILEAGGTALDAAISAQMVLNLVEPQSSGIGGGAFILYYDAKTNNIYAWDGREKAPMSFSEDVFLNSNGKKKGFIEAVSGGLAVGVPALISMLEKAHNLHGNMPWNKLFEDAITLSTEGFIVGKRLSKLISRAPHLKNQKIAREYFNIDGGGLKEGDLIKNVKFAESLKLIRDNGAQSILNGILADSILSTVTGHIENPGIMVKKDFSFVNPLHKKPVCGSYRKWKICGMGPPSSGGITVLQILGILNNFDLSSENAQDPYVWHLFLEASKLAYTDRGYYIADNDFINVPIDEMLDEKYLKARSKLIKKDSIISNPKKGEFKNINSSYLGIDSTSEQPSTTHLSIIDKYGNALALTSSIEFMFGSGLMASGFLLNNQMTDFSFYPKDKDGNLIANRPEGKKKPRSSMSPTLAFDSEGELRIILGSPGGSQIICYVAASLVRIIDLNISPEKITEQPNICNRGYKSDVEEGTIGDVLTKELEKKGHKINRKSMTSGIHIIYKDNIENLHGIADQRREGTAFGL